MLYYCNACIICTPNLSDYNKHIQTKKHIKKTTTTNTVSSIYDSNECNVNLKISDNQLNIANDRNVKKTLTKTNDVNIVVYVILIHPDYLVI